MSTDTSMNRRGFIAGSGLTMLSMTGLALPIALPAAAESIGVIPQPAADWSIDDMWTGFPRPSHPIGYGRVAVTDGAVRLAGAQPGTIDVLFG